MNLDDMSDTGSELSASSPIATGGGGTFFEQHVGAYFLALLLARGIPPLLKDCQVEEVHFQAEHLGWDTDDILIIGNRADDHRRKLAIQVKRTFTVSSSDDACRKAFEDFWRDFIDRDKFDPNTDRLALVTFQGTSTLLNKFASLLDCARASTDGSDFEHRLSVNGLLSKKAHDQASAIRSILNDVSEESITTEAFWQFLSVLHVISLDLHSPTAQHESWIKMLLAQTSNSIDPFSVADSTWSELLQLVGTTDGMPAAASYRYEKLPEVLRQRHLPLLPRPSGHLGQLIDHSSITLEGIDTFIANSVEVRREGLETRVFESLETTQVAVISGAAGHGKSAVAKNVIENLKESFFCLAFRAEEFAVSHIDQTLKAVQNSLTAKQLLGLLSAQSRTIILIESIERLLESSERKAFTDLLNLARTNSSLRLILTCRDYSVDTVKTSLLEQVALRYEVLDVPPFTDEELNQVAELLPELASPIQSPILRETLRSPYFLNIAARIDWSKEEELPHSEQEFRALCWSEVVRSNVDASIGMPRERERVFVQLALRRAKELRPYVPCEDFNDHTLEALRRDSLISYSARTQALAAPAHDVLEDWAIIHWLDGQFATHEGDPIAFAEAIGGYPALRRGYRKWLGEMLACAFDEADSFVLGVFNNESIPAFFRDDTIICTLLSASAEDFLMRNRGVLLEDDGQLLVQVVHLLRVACKTAPSWLPNVRGLGSLLLVPTGTAWAPVLKIVSGELEVLLPDHFGLVLGLVEDWSQQVTYWKPRPDGYSDAGTIVARLLDDLGGYNDGDMRRRALEIFAKIPGSSEESFKDLLYRASSSDSRDDVASEFAELLLTESNSAYVCRDFPEETIQLAMDFFCLTEEDVENALRSQYGYNSSLRIGPRFGIREELEFKFSVPASAIRGPFWFLLRSHPRLGVDFVIALMNHACLWYGEQRWPFDPLEPAWQTTLRIPEEDEPITQWANMRLYAMYRGGSVAPYVLQSALMALERWLLEIANIEGVNLESWLLKLVRESNNVAVTAVVASVCIAEPQKSGRAALALLSSHDVIRLDRGRMVHDQTNTSMARLMPSLQAKHKIYDDERIASDDLKHRKSDLESLAISLQFGDRREEVWHIIDQHCDELPPAEDQTEGDRVWRLALHRMDVRGFKLGEEVAPTDIEEANADTGDKSEGRYFTLIPSEIEPDVQEVVDRNAEQLAQQTADLPLLNWGLSAWRRDLKPDSKSWRAILSTAIARDAEVQENSKDNDEQFDFMRGGVEFIAAVCVRDHWDDLDSDERSWCTMKLIAEIDRYTESDDYAILQSRGSMFPDRAAAYALSRVAREQGVDDVDEHVVAAIATALTHPVFEINEYAADGIGFYLGEANEVFAMRCAGALAKRARLIHEVQKSQRSKPYTERQYGRELVQSVLTEIKQDLISGNVDTESELAYVIDHELFGQVELRLILRILSQFQGSGSTIHLYEQITNFLIQDWGEQKQDRFGGNRRDIQFEYWVADQLAGFALSSETEDAVLLYTPITEAIEAHPEEVNTFLQALIHEEDKLDGETPFWNIWQAFADQLVNAKWIGDLDLRYYDASKGASLLTSLLFGISWKEDVRYWRRLKDQEYRVEAVVQNIPATVSAFKSYCRFLYHIGKESLPDSFTIVAERLDTGETPEVLTDTNTVFYLEALLRRYVYGQPLQLKAKPQVRQAVLYILDRLVAAGSSAAYQMRDDFVTPISPAASI